MRDRSSHKRTLLKAVTWETFSWFLTAGVAYLYTGSLRSGGSMATTLLLVKIVFLYLHDRMWHQISWGKEKCQCYRLDKAHSCVILEVVEDETQRDHGTDDPPGQ